MGLKMKSCTWMPYRAPFIPRPDFIPTTSIIE